MVRDAVDKSISTAVGHFTSTRDDGFHVTRHTLGCVSSVSSFRYYSLHRVSFEQGTRSIFRPRICAMAPTTTPRRSASDQLSLISKNKVSAQEAQQVLIAAFTAKDYVDCVKNLNGRKIDPQAYIDGLDRVRSRPPMLTKEHVSSYPISDNRHPATRVRNLSPKSSSPAKDLRNLRAPPIFTPHVRGFDPSHR